MLKKFNQGVTEGFLFVDQYELVMAQLYFKLGLHEDQVQFEHFFRDYPDYGSHKAGYCINAGLEWFVDWMQNTSVTENEIELLRRSKTAAGKNLYSDEFLNWLKNNGNFSQLNLKSIPEGRVIHPNVPITVVTGPLGISQLAETALLNQINYQILIATKASRIKEIVKNQTVIEFGARRAHDRGAVAGARAALIGGADFTSNVGISYQLGFPPKGTHAHSMVQLFLALGKSELDAFEAFADLYPDDCILLIDTIDTLNSGLPNAIKVFEKLKRNGHSPIGIRLDSGDLAYLTIKCAAILDKSGFENTKIVLSNELDELRIWQILSQIKKETHYSGVDADKIINRLIFGVGTNLITSSGDSALSGVYKIAAVKYNGNWQPTLKLSETAKKMTLPGEKQIWRIIESSGKATADLICKADENPESAEMLTLINVLKDDDQRQISKKNILKLDPLLVDIITEGKLKYEFPTIHQIRETRDSDLNQLDFGVRRLINPHYYQVSISKKIWELKKNLINRLNNN
jgi:nicotinate phosphoribosyltransferase